MKKNKFIIDLSTINLTDKQIKDIQSGIEKVVTETLIENVAFNSEKLNPITKEMVEQKHSLFQLPWPFFGFILE